MCIRFILDSMDEKVSAIVELSSMDGISHIEMLRNGQLLFVCDTSYQNHHLEGLPHLLEKIGRLFGSDEKYSLDYITTNQRKYNFLVFGRLGHDGAINRKISCELFEKMLASNESLSPEEKEIEDLFLKIFARVINVDNISSDSKE